MKAHYKAFGGRLVFEVEGDSPKALTEAIAELQEIFEADSTCGCCGSNAIRLNVRSVDNNKYYSWACAACSAELAMGQHRNGRTLFLKRPAGDPELLPHRGWRIYRRDEKDSLVNRGPQPKQAVRQPARTQ